MSQTTEATALSPNGMKDPDATFKARLMNSQLLRLLNRYSFGFALLLTVVLFVWNYLSVPGGLSMQSQLTNLAPMALAAMASTPAIISGRGGFDISISPLMVLVSAVYAAWLMPNGLGGAISIPIMLAVGAGVGLINGLIIIFLRVQPVVATLATFFILMGVNVKIVPSALSIPDTWLRELSGGFGPFPAALVLILFPLFVWFLLGRTPYRRTLYAVGSNDATAFSAGVNVPAVRLVAYTLGGLFAAVAGMAILAVSGSASASLSMTYTLIAIASVALGGTSLLGGRGGLFGSLLGAASIYLLGNLLVSMQVDPSWLQVIYGVMLVLAVVLVAAAARTRESK